MDFESLEDYELRELLYGKIGTSWRDKAACRNMDKDDFYPERGQAAKIKRAREICRGCEVRGECLEFALAIGEKLGVWGGTSERERRRIRAARKLQRAVYPAEKVA